MYKKEKYEELKKRFLNPLENNKNDLIESLRVMLDNIAETQNEYNAYVGESITNNDWLNEFDNVPYNPIDRQYLLESVPKVLSGQIKWHSPAALHNINPPTMIDSVAATALINLYNPNALWDFVSGGVLQMEKQIVNQISDLCFWNKEDSEGIFTFGGKGCLTYAIKIGINRVVQNCSSEGLDTSNIPVVITSEDNHYSIDMVCSLLGIGSNSCIRIPTDKLGIMDMDKFKNTVSSLVKKNIPIACIVLSGGNTLNNSVDPLEKVHMYINELIEDNRLTYKPFIHFDTVVSWPWLFFRDYDFNLNPLEVEKKTLNQIYNLFQKVKKVELADSMGIDFHKDGFTPYNSSLYVIKNGSELTSIFKDNIVFEKEKEKEYGNNFMQYHTIEHSRSASPIVSAWVSLQGSGILGMQSYIVNMMTIANIFRTELVKKGLELVNEQSLSFCSLFWSSYPGGIKNFSDCLISEKKEIDETNDYLYRLSLEFARGKFSNHKIVIGFIPDYMINDRGMKIAALRIYPMSMHMDTDNTLEIIKNIVHIKKNFDRDYNIKEKSSEKMPLHVPK